VVSGFVLFEWRLWDVVVVVLVEYVIVLVYCYVEVV